MDKLPRTSRQHIRVKGQCDFDRDIYPYMFFRGGSLHGREFYLIKVGDKWMNPKYDTIDWNIADPDQLIEVQPVSDDEQPQQQPQPQQQQQHQKQQQL